jgi:hypothetical protein
LSLPVTLLFNPKINIEPGLGSFTLFLEAGIQNFKGLLRRMINCPVFSEKFQSVILSGSKLEKKVFQIFAILGWIVSEIFFTASSLAGFVSSVKIVHGIRKQKAIRHVNINFMKSNGVKLHHT